MRFINGIFDWKVGCVGSVPLINLNIRPSCTLYSRLKFKKWRSQRSEDGIAEFLTKMEQKKHKNKQNIVCSMNVLYTMY